LYHIAANHLAASPSSGQAFLYYVAAIDLTASPTWVCLAARCSLLAAQHLLIDWLELPSGSGHTTYLCVAVAIPSCNPSAFARCTGHLAASVGARQLMRHYWIVWSTSAGLLCIQCLESQQPLNSQGPCMPTPERTGLLLLQPCCQQCPDAEAEGCWRPQVVPPVQPEQWRPCCQQVQVLHVSSGSH
jgi:hypothetical protein